MITSVAIYDKLDSQLARPAHRIYDRARVEFFTGQGLREETAETLAQAERHAERTGWACRWSWEQDTYRCELRDMDGNTMGMFNAGVPRVTVEFTRIVEAELAAGALGAGSLWDLYSMQVMAS